MIEQTLGVLIGQEGIKLRSLIEDQLVKAGLVIRVSELIHSEDLEEAGIEIKLEEEEEPTQLQVHGQEELKHVCLVLEGGYSVYKFKELIGKEGTLNRNCFTSLYPNLKIYSSPSSSAASMAIEVLYPNLEFERVQSQNFNQSGISISQSREKTSPLPLTPTSISSPSSNVAPFALSNLSHPSPPRSTRMSDAMERALALHDYNDDIEEQFDHLDRESEGEQEEEEAEEEEEAVEILSASAEDAGFTNSSSPRRISTPPSPSASSSTFTSASMTHSLSNSSTPSFRDDSMPSSKGNPHPRLTKTAKMRLGMAIEPRPVRRPSTSQSNVSDLSKSTRVIAPVKALAAPKVEVRTTKSSTLRTGTDNSTTTTTPTNLNRTREIASGTSDRSSNTIFDNIPGFKRRESITVTSTARPKVEVRMTKGASLRAGLPVEVTGTGLSRRAESGVVDVVKKSKDKQVSTFGREEGGRMGPPPLPSINRKTSSGRMSLGGLSNGNGLGTRAEVLEDLVEGGDVDTPRPGTKVRRQSTSMPRMTKTAMMRLGTPFEIPVNRRNSSTTTNYDGVPGHAGRDPISVASSRPPTIQPRTNRSTLLRMSTSENSNVTSSFHSNRRASTDTSTTTSRSQSQSRPSSSLSNHKSSTTTSIIPKVPKAPSIQPRMNRTEQLRIAKKEREELARVKLSSVKTRRPGELRLEKSSKPLALGDYSNGGDSPRRSTFAE